MSICYIAKGLNPIFGDQFHLIRQQVIYPTHPRGLPAMQTQGTCEAGWSWALGVIWSGGLTVDLE